MLNKIKPPYNINQLTQIKALERLEALSDVKNEVQNILEQRNILRNALAPITFIKQIYPSDANFILAKVDDANLRYHQLIEKGIVVRNRTTQVLCENCLRFTVGTAEENNILIKILNQLS